MRSSAPTWSAAAATPSRSGSSGPGDFGFRTVNDPHGSGATTLNGINDAGDLVGFYTDAKGNTDGLLVAHGHFRAPLAPPVTTTTPVPTRHAPRSCRPRPPRRPRADRGGTNPLLTAPGTNQPPRSRRAGPELPAPGPARRAVRVACQRPPARVPGVKDTPRSTAAVWARPGPVSPLGQAESAGTWPALALRITCLRNSSAAGSRRRSADQVRVRSRTAPASRISQ